MSISATAATARENARKTDGKFGHYALGEAGTETDLDMDLDWLDDDQASGGFGVTPDFGADPTPEPDLRQMAEGLSWWLSENRHDIGWGTPDRPEPGPWDSKTDRMAYLSEHSPILPSTARAEQHVVALGAQVAARGEALAGVDVEAERAAYTARLTQAQADFDAAEVRRKELEEECRQARATGAFSVYLGEVAAGRSGPFTDRLRADIEKVRPGMAADADALATRRSVAATQLSLVKRGRDPESLAVLSKLADGYAQALSEVRQTGGEPTFHAKATKPARTAFTEAASVYPADWIETSNADRTQMLPKISKKRAHYAHSKVETTKKKVRSGYDHRAPLQDIEEMNAQHPLTSYELIDATPDAQGHVLYLIVSESAPPFRAEVNRSGVGGVVAPHTEGAC